MSVLRRSLNRLYSLYRGCLKSTRRRTLGRTLRRSLVAEFCETRLVFANLSDVPTQAAVAAVPVGAESARDFICDPVFDRSGTRELMVPAPLIADLNFDGLFIL